MVSKSSRQGAQTGEETRRSRDERKRRSRVTAARAAAPRDHASSPADDEWYDASPSLSPRCLTRGTRAACPRSAAGPPAVTAATEL